METVDDNTFYACVMSWIYLGYHVDITITLLQCATVKINCVTDRITGHALSLPLCISWFYFKLVSPLL